MKENVCKTDVSGVKYTVSVEEKTKICDHAVVGVHHSKIQKIHHSYKVFISKEFI